MAAKKKKTKSAARKPAKKPAARKAPAKKAAKPKGKKKAAKKAPARKAPKAKGKNLKTRAQALAEARKKIARTARTPRLSAKTGTWEVSQAVIQAYAQASREMAEWLAAARKSE